MGRVRLNRHARDQPVTSQNHSAAEEFGESVKGFPGLASALDLTPSARKTARISCLGCSWLLALGSPCMKAAPRVSRRKQGRWFREGHFCRVSLSLSTQIRTLHPKLAGKLTALQSKTACGRWLSAKKLPGSDSTLV